MYLDFHGLRERPFNLTPDPRFIFLSKNHREVLAHLFYGIKNRVGFIVLTGEVGSGKTTVLRTFLSQLDGDLHRTALIFNPCLSPLELLQNINREFGILTTTSNRSALLDGLNQFLLRQNAEGRTVLLIIDESQILEAAVLEQIRLISNLETDREKLIQIILSGQPELMQILARKSMRQLNQRITVRYHLQPMDFQDTVHYINHRLKVAGGKGSAIFSGGALKRIYKYSRGLPRLINAACDRALLAGFTSEATGISSRIAAAGIKSMSRNAAPGTWRRRLILVPVVGLFAALVAGGFYLARRDVIGPFNAAQDVGAIKEAAAVGALNEKEGQKKSDPIMANNDLAGLMAEEIGKVSETESLRRAFNTLAALWSVPPVPEGDPLNQPNRMERAALNRDLRVYRYAGNLGALLRIDYPTALELTLPGLIGKRFVSLVGRKNEQLLIDPPIAGKKSLSFDELERHWSGQGFLLWKDPLNLPARLSVGSKGDPIKRLQGLLREAGATDLSLTGVYDDDTLSAVKEFQASKGIQQDGIVGGQTLMVLYRSIDRFAVPTLTAGRK